MQFIKKYQWLLPSLLFTAALLAIRMVHTRSIAFLFLPWNLVLAAFPLIFSYKLLQIKNTYLSWGMFGLWLLFFPNAMYIVTDLFHLKEGAPVPQWFDLLLLFSAALNGVIMGLVSLRNAEIFLHKKVGKRLVPVIICCIFLLCGYGIYLGRYLRWNSWDIFTQPHLLLWDIAMDVRHPFQNEQSWMVTSLFGIWMYILYRYFSRIRRWSR